MARLLSMPTGGKNLAALAKQMVVTPAPAGSRPQLVPLVPSVKLKNFRQKDPVNESAESKYSQIRLQVVARDRYTCQYCKFTTRPDRNAGSNTLLASGYLEAHHIDDDHMKNVPNNLITICPFCHMIYHLGFAAHNDRFIMIYFPWLKQEQINLMVNCLGVAIHRGGHTGEQAARMLQWLIEHKAKVHKNIGPILADPINLAASLGKLGRSNPDLYANRHEALANIRFIPKLREFKDPIKYWAASGWLFKNWEQAWENVYEQWAA